MVSLLKALEKERKANNRQRIEWVKYWAERMKEIPNEVWSKQQAEFINSVMRSADVSPEIYMKIKKSVEKS